MKTILIAVLSLLASSTFAQSSATWTGGTPGNETSWNEARNWSNNRIPNEFTDVIIPDVSTSTFSAPVIKGGTIELNSIRITSGAQLSIESSAKLIVYGFTEGLVKENIKLNGTLMVIDDLTGSGLENVVLIKN